MLKHGAWTEQEAFESCDKQRVTAASRQCRSRRKWIHFPLLWPTEIGVDAVQLTATACGVQRKIQTHTHTHTHARTHTHADTHTKTGLESTIVTFYSQRDMVVRDDCMHAPSNTQNTLKHTKHTDTHTKMKRRRQKNANTRDWRCILYYYLHDIPHQIIFYKSDRIKLSAYGHHHEDVVKT
jgi:hypothetical protein